MIRLDPILVPPLSAKDRHLLSLASTERGGKVTLGSGLAARPDGKESETENYSTSRRIAKMTRHLLYPLLFRGSLDSFQVQFPLMVRRAFFFPKLLRNDFLIHIYLQAPFSELMI